MERWRDDNNTAVRGILTVSLDSHSCLSLSLCRLRIEFGGFRNAFTDRRNYVSKFLKRKAKVLYIDTELNNDMPTDPSPPQISLPQVDYLLTDATVYDGLGTAAVRADIAVLGDTIAAIGTNLVLHYHAGMVIDASGLAASPGFIDIHTHSDLSVLVTPLFDSSIHQGVTTEVSGNCGMAAGAMTSSGDFAFERRWLERSGVTLSWDTFGGFLDRVEQEGTAINICSLVGHGTLRKLAKGSTEGKADAGEIAIMQRAVADAMASGAVGLSTGLEYLPGGYADLDEIAPLAQIAHEAGGFYASHIRNEGDTLIESVTEAIAVGRQTHIPVQVSHLKAEGHKNWGKVRAALGLMADARADGFDVLTDQYPYAAFMTGLSVILLPKWALAGTPDDIARRMVSTTDRDKIRSEILADPLDWTKVQVGIARVRREAQGLTLEQLGALDGKHPVDSALDLLRDERGWVSAVHFALSDEDIETVLRDPHTMIGSDGVAASPTGAMGDDKTHPRSYGAFPRVLGAYVRDRSVLSLSDAIRRMTSLPASRLGLIDRGRLAPGMKADITLFRPETVADTATFDNPQQFASGIEYVFVNGRLALSGGVQRDIRPGRVLRRRGGTVI